MRKTFFILICGLLFFTSCEKEENLPPDADGMRPIYIDGDDSNLIKAEGPREFGELGAISERGQYLYIIERYKGIHVVDNSNPNTPKNVAFWAIPGCVSMTFSDDRLYVQNTKNLWVIQIISLTEIKVLDREVGVFSTDTFDKIRPPRSYSGPFECVDLKKGVVIGWERAFLKAPLCRTI